MKRPVVERHAMAFLDRMAVNIARQFRCRLNYSHASVRTVEEILGTYHREYREQRREDGLRGVAVAFAAYLVRVIERHSEPGSWRLTVPVHNGNALPYVWRGRTLFPYRWCLERVLEGDPGGLWRRYNAEIVERLDLERRQAGTPRSVVRARS